MEDLMYSRRKQVFSIFALLVDYSGITVEGRFWREKGVRRVRLFFQLVLCTAIGLLLFYRSSVYAQKQGLFQQWFEWDWCLELIYMYMALHAFMCFITIVTWTRSNYIGKFLDILTCSKKVRTRTWSQIPRLFLKTLQETTVKSLARPSQPFLFALSIFFVLAGVVTTAETLVFDGLVSPFDNSTMALYRTSVFKTNCLVALDILLFLYSLLLSATCVAIFCLMNQAALLEYRLLQKDLEKAIEGGTHLDPELILSLNLRQLRLSNVFRFVADHAGALVGISFLTGLVNFLFGTFVLTAFHDSRRWFEMAIFVLWVIVGHLLMLVPISKLEAVQREISKTRDLLVTEESIWSCNDEAVLREVNAFVERIDRSRFPFKVLGLITADERIFALAMLSCSVIMYVFFYFRKIQSL
ncbi:hypothetical protein QR680_005460 [Steinernema hermaphroditum]|uniref:Uncharacterized protein n=1 Tax=Steinernema hermaphroditum TaxID=289476 RepID=A0AA39HS46_9BILA|nr:hypothetical protein QR680_005460 [Steinernema hermaphroditum]